MCGIAGFSHHSNTAFSTALIAGVLQQLAHRGPDGNGSYIDQSHGVCLLHTRLSVLDVSPSGHQPMLSPDNSVALVFNGEIYNFKELREELTSNGFSFNGFSDTEVLLNLYLYSRGNSLSPESFDRISHMLNRLNGIFSFSIWDKRLNAILIARDSFGVKPLYYHSSADFFQFSSELKAISGNVPPELDVDALHKYLTFLWCPGASTPLNGVKKLGPGEMIWVSQGQIINHTRWFNLESIISSPKRNSTPSVDTITSVASGLRQAVHRQMVSDVPLGAFLSGGLDSSSIVAFASEINPDIETFTIKVDGLSDEGFSDDLPYASRVANHLGVNLNVINVDAHQIASSINEMVWQLDEPLADIAPLNARFICSFARSQGIKVLLSGAGGDDLFTGYRRHFALQSERFWSWLPRDFRIALRDLSGFLPSNYSFFRRLRKAFSGAHLDGDQRLINYFRWIDRSDLISLYTPEFRASLSDAFEEDPLLNFLSLLPSSVCPLDRMLSLEQRFFLPEHNLLYTDKMSMSVGVEVRVPFLDSDLVQLASSIPNCLKQRGRTGKWVLKKAMEPYLPKHVIYRPKSGFGVPLRSWLNGELRDWLLDILSPERLRRRGLFDPHAVQLLISDNATGKIDASYTLLSLACIEIWCSNFLDSPTTSSPSLIPV